MPGDEFVARARRLVAEREYQEAVKTCRLGLLASPTRVEGRLVLSAALMALGRLDEALAEVRVVLEFEPGNLQGLVRRGELLLRLGEVQLASEALERASRLAPGDPETRALCEEARRARLGTTVRALSYSDSPETRVYPAHEKNDGASPGGRPDEATPTPDTVTSMVRDEFTNQATVPASPRSVRITAHGARGGGAVIPDEQIDLTIPDPRDARPKASGLSVPPLRDVARRDEGEARAFEARVVPKATAGSLPSKSPTPTSIPTRPTIQRPTGRRVSVRALGGLSVLAVAAGLLVGLLLREARFGTKRRQILALAASAASEQAAPGLARAEALYRAVLEHGHDEKAAAALARAAAARALDFGGSRKAAEALVAALGQSKFRDAAVARLLVVLIRGVAPHAQELAEELAMRFPRDAEVLYLLGRAQLLDERFEEGVATLARAESFGGGPLVLLHLASALADLGRWDEAWKRIDEACMRFPTHLGAWIERAHIMGLGGAPPLADDDLFAEAHERLRDLVATGEASGQENARWGKLALAELLLSNGHGREAGATLQGLHAAAGDARFSLSLIGALLGSGELSRAQSEARLLVSELPTMGRPLLALAQVLLAEARPGEALAAVGKSGRARKLALARLVAARALVATSQWDMAAKELDALLAATPRHREAAIVRAVVDIKRGDPRAAIARLGPLHAEDRDPSISVALGQALRVAGERARAVEVLTPATDSPRGGEAHLELARLYRDEGRLALARDAYAKAIERLPEKTEARLETGLLLLDLGDTSGARLALEALSRDAPSSADVLLATVRVLLATGDTEAAKRTLDRIAQMPRAPQWEVAREKGRLALIQGNGPQAVAAIGEAVALAPDDPELRHMLVVAHVLAGDGAGAQVALADMIKRHAGRPEADLARGRVHLSNGHVSEAISALVQANKLLDKKPAPPRARADARTSLGRAYFYRGDLGLAEKALREAMELEPARAEALVLLGSVHLEQKRFPLARKSFEQAIAINSSTAEAYYLLGVAARRMRDINAARKALTTYLEKAPRGEHAKEARALLR
ncbi:MAG: tetratricopeptide repeat protein [Deltaproteobacteria bacterium]|nr:tetratricopeptide repeat protein [Deltaproteobacteria bacterium]